MAFAGLFGKSGRRPKTSPGFVKKKTNFSMIQSFFLPHFLVLKKIKDLFTHPLITA
jgi:hypothetical protein